MKLESADGQSVELEKKFILYNLQTRTRRSIKSFAIGIGLAVCSLPLPGLHFFLVPSFLIYAVYSAFARFHELYLIDLSGARCPKCQNELSEKKLRLKSLPGRLYCYECRTQLRII